MKKETQRRDKAKSAKLMDKYGIPKINEWVKKHPNTIAKLAYELYLEEERRIAIMKIIGCFFLFLSIVCGVISFFIPGFTACMIMTLVVGCDILTNNRIDNLEQQRWRDMVYSMYCSEKEEEKDVKKHSKV